MLPHSSAQTIYALASAPGKAGVAVFRISGPHAQAALTALGVEKPLVPRVATLVTLLVPSSNANHERTILDQALALFFPAPHSFTGEDIVELHTHGSRAITKLLFEALLAIPGCRLAEAGEFARRAFLAGKLDLAQAEGLADLIDAETKAQHAQAIRQLGGEHSGRIEALRQAILEPLALLEAYIDFPDEEIPEQVLHQTNQHIHALTLTLAELLNDHAIGEKIRDGLEIVILGPPNVGKSSLLNLLARREAAIVSPEAGTTRDAIEVPMEIGGYAVTLVDTAGIRESEHQIEAEGIRRTKKRAQQADLKLWVIDIDMVSSPEFIRELEQKRDEQTLIVVNKCDLGEGPSLPFPFLAISVKENRGIAGLMDALTTNIAERMEHHTSPLITQSRHREALNQAFAALRRVDTELPLELVCEELRVTARAIGKITGKIAVDDVLDLVFSRFCIGK